MKNKAIISSLRSMAALARLYYLARPTKTAMLRRLISFIFLFLLSENIGEREDISLHHNHVIIAYQGQTRGS